MYIIESYPFSLIGVPFSLYIKLDIKLSIFFDRNSNFFDRCIEDPFSLIGSIFFNRGLLKMLFWGVLGGRKGWTLKIRQRGSSLGNFE